MMLAPKLNALSIVTPLVRFCRLGFFELSGDRTGIDLIQDRRVGLGEREYGCAK